MAIVKNFWLKNSSKKLAGAVLYKAMGQTRSRELASEVSNPRTTDQMTQRTRWANLVNFYRVNSSWMKFAYETKPTNRTDYNQFMSLNAGNSRIYLTKQLANQGACIVDSYQMTQGSLGSIEVLPYDEDWQTNLYLDYSSRFGPTVLVSEFADELIRNNPAIREGDQLSFIRLTQQTNPNTGVPFVVVRKYEVILKTDDLRFLRDFLPLDYISSITGNNRRFVQVLNSGLAGGFLLILSRTVGGKTYVSTQSIVVANNDALISQYSSSAAIQAAIDSYGESSEPFLTSTTAETDSQAPVGLSVLSVTIDGVDYTPLSIVYPINIDQDTRIKINMSGPVEGGTGEFRLYFVDHGQEREYYYEVESVSGNSINISAVQAGILITNVALANIEFDLESGDYRAPFVVPNAAFQSGLE